jgi:hypothetical protein
MKQVVALFSFQCPITHICENDQCFWRQRDVHGLSPFYNHNDPKGLENKKITDKHGESIFPKIYSSTGTNTITTYCEDFICKNWKNGCYSGHPKEETKKLRNSIFMYGLPSIKETKHENQN